LVSPEKLLLGVKLMLGEVFSDEDCDAADEAPELLAAFLRAAIEALTSRINAVKSYSQSCTYMLNGKDTSTIHQPAH